MPMPKNALSAKTSLDITAAAMANVAAAAARLQMWLTLLWLEQLHSC